MDTLSEYKLEYEEIHSDCKFNAKWWTDRVATIISDINGRMAAVRLKRRG